MSAQISDNIKRIAKNTLHLDFRMIFMKALTLNYFLWHNQ